MAKHIFKTRVRYDEVDQMGVVHNSVYYIYMELARTDLVRAEGYPYKRIEEDGFFMPVLESACTFRQPARYDDVLHVETTIQFMKNSSLRFNYDIQRDDGAPIARGYTVHAAVDRNFEVALIPDRYRDFMAKYLEG